MYGKRQGGLAGKARRAHHLDRFERWLGEELIEEFDNPAPVELGIERYIPVHHGAEVLSRVHFSSVSSVWEPSEQLDLPFTSDGGWEEQRSVATVAAKARPDVAWKPYDATRPVVAAAGRVERQAAKPTKASEVIIPSRRGQPAPPVTERSEFKLHRFLAGCLVGGSAAAALLLVWHVIIR